MSDLPAGDGHEVIHLGGEAAVVVPLEEYRRLRELERFASPLEEADVEDTSALADYRRRRRRAPSSWSRTMRYGAGSD
jgi:hypothetical protein